MKKPGNGQPHPKGRTLLLTLAFSSTLIVSWIGWAFYSLSKLDLLIVDGLVVDGTGRAPYSADIAIQDGKIVGISRWKYWFSSPKARIYAAGKIVAPGFIDVHTHIESNLQPNASFKPENFLRQGVTTLITGNCGRSQTKVHEMLTLLEKNGTYINAGTLIGHNSVRRIVMGQAARAPTVDELQQMKQMVGQAMEDGALGFSTGLAYAPGRFAKTDELVALARTAAERGGVYASHIRDESQQGELALQEALEIGRQAGAVTQISHLKCSGRAQWHTMKRRLAMIDQARATGVKVNVDVYPYDHSSTTTDVLLPDWALAESRAGLRRAVSNQQTRQQLRADIMNKLNRDGWADLRYIKLVAGKSEWVGHSLTEVPLPAATLEQQVENLIDISLQGGAQAIFADMHEEDVALVLENPFCLIGSDSGVRDPEAAYKPHPRGAGTFPRIFCRYVQEAQRLDVAAAVRKASGLAADVFRLEGRGYLLPGNWADIVVFDLERIEDKANYDQPFAEPTGIDYVIVNGEVVIEHRSFTSHRPTGMALRSVSSSLEKK